MLQEIANIQFTSGTAELPKGFLLTHRYWVGSSPERPVNRWPADHAATCLCRVVLGRSLPAGGGSMGLCFPTRESKIIDSNLQEVPVGVSGELCLRGEGMMLGYHNRDEVNAELFLPGGWFRTGDLVRKDAEGAHYYEGRLKDMVNRSGENIASAEVELQILLMPEVHAVGVIPVPDRERGEEVKAIVVLKDGARVSAEDVVAHARTGLAAFKVPRYVEFRTELP